MNLKFNSKGSQGFTLIELLVVMLILVILGIAGLPAIRENMVRARYAADAVPAISDIRTKVELYRYEHDHLPGVVYQGSHRNPELNSYTNATLAYIQSMTYGEEGNAMILGSGVPAYVTEDWNGDSDLTKLQSAAANTCMATNPVAGSDLVKYHVFKQIDDNYENLRGRFVNPYNFQYVVPYCNGSDYCWAVAVVGTGNGLPKGTAYAVLEYNNTALKVKFLATFEKYKAENGVDSPMNFSDMLATGASSANDPKKRILIGDANYDVRSTFMDDQSGRSGMGTAQDEDAARKNLEGFKAQLETAGWTLD